ncbi:50S ribosomal protein L24 [candidate division WOR-3 bacterium]|uniref:Large ribosomal subunit protein uL24 n=1 Tax=candidate division WOR-3 bacterium TaxID=2052148 RepID=A0A660SCT4_UNCW3|nr:MAG: 50S ribosomal protein L24 [candidate division WOR-3 bacterium]
MNIKKGDIVVVISGDEKGRRGKVLEVQPKKNRVVIEGVNLVKKHTRMQRGGRPGGILTIPAPIHISNVQLICPRCGKRTRVRRDKVEGRRLRFCKECGEQID